MESLTCKSLMIGDWVMVYPWDETPWRAGKITDINFHSWEGTDFCDSVGVEGWDDLTLDQIKPIPLTPEILEKNGWKHEFDKADYMVKYNLGEEGKNCWMMWSIKEHNLDVQRQDENLDMYNLKVSKVVIPCDYVHQLQQALRLCGIEKEIEL